MKEKIHMLMKCSAKKILPIPKAVVFLVIKLLCLASTGSSAYDVKFRRLSWLIKVHIRDSFGRDVGRKWRLSK